MTPPTMGDDRGMHRFTASRRAMVATAGGLVLSLSLVACSQLAGGAQRDVVGCSLEQFHGNLVADDGRAVFRSIQHNLPSDPVPLDVPDGWGIRATDGGQFEVLDGTGTVRVTTGTRVIVLSDGDPNSPVLNVEGAFVVCDAVPWPPDLDPGDAP
jgi:hypothetical protein